MFLSEFNFRLEFAPGKRNPADGPSRRADFVPKEGDAVLTGQQQMLLTKIHTERIYPGDVHPSEVSSSSVKVSALTTIALDNSKLVERFKLAFRDNVEWRNALQAGSEDFTLQDNLVFYNGRLFVPASLRSDVLRSRHDAVTAGHPGRARTLNLVERDFSWPGLKTFVRQYVSACDICARIKAPRHKPYGLLKPLDIPDRPWQSISMDFIVKLPLSHGYDSIWVVCDRLTRAAHFVPCSETINAPELAWLFLDRIFRHHGLPTSIISDHRSVFVSKFWRELTRLLQIDLRTSTAYHPQTDGLTERTNQTLEVYLRAYTSYQQDDWVDYLPLAEFAFDNSTNTSTKQTPYFANLGFHPTFDAPLTERGDTVPAAGDFAARLDIIHAELKAELREAQLAQMRFYNTHHRLAPQFKQNDLVWLLRRNINTTLPSDKLDYRKLGPYPVTHAYGKDTYRLKLPRSLARLHPSFHASVLEPYEKPADVLQRPSARPARIAIDANELAIKSILDCRKVGRRYDYFVHWCDQPVSERSWIPLSDVPTAHNESLEWFHCRHPGLPRPTVSQSTATCIQHPTMRREQIRTLRRLQLLLRYRMPELALPLLLPLDKPLQRLTNRRRKRQLVPDM